MFAEHALMDENLEDAYDENLNNTDYLMSRRNKKVITKCSHKNSKHYAKVLKFFTFFRTCVVIVIIQKEGIKNLGNATTIINFTTLWGCVKIAINQIILR